ncbi:cation transporter, partial [Microcystis sp. LE19-59.1C]
NTITKAINNQQPAAQISVDVANKIVTVETTASPAEIAQWISEVGHTVESSSEG